MSLKSECALFRVNNDVHHDHYLSAVGGHLIRDDFLDCGPNLHLLVCLILDCVLGFVPNLHLLVFLILDCDCFLERKIRARCHEFPFHILNRDLTD